MTEISSNHDFTELSYIFGCILKTKPRSKNETSREIGQKKRNLGGGRFLKKKNETCPKGRFQKKKTQPGRRPGCVFFSDIRTLTGYRVMIFFAKKHIINTHMHCHKSLCMYVFSMYVLYVNIWKISNENKQRFLGLVKF